MRCLLGAEKESEFHMKKLATLGSMVVVSALLAVSCTTLEDIPGSETSEIEESAPEVEEELVRELFEPVPPAIENPLTWETLVERSEELPGIVYDDVYVTIERNKQSSGYNDVEYTLYRSPNLADLHYAEIDSWLDDMFALYANTVQPDSEIYIAFPYEDLEWAVELLSDPRVNHPDYEVIVRNANQGPEQGSRQNAVPGMQPGTWQGIWLLPATLGPEPGVYPSFAVHEESLINHEYAHQVQQRQFKDENLNSRFAGMAVGVPCFLMEGTARIPELALIFDTPEEFAVGMGTRDGAYLYDPESADELGNFTVVTYLTEEVTVEYAENYLRTSLEPKCDAGNQYALGYSLGYLAVEGLAAIGGVESTMNLFTRIGYHDIPFEEAFEGIYGITWEEAVPILAALIAKEYG
jgi:hypothetical protein